MQKEYGKTFPWIYQRYLDWFRVHARPEAHPKTEEELIGFHIGGEDVYDGSLIQLHRLIYSVPLTGSEALSGKAELFGFSELNLMEKSDAGDDDVVAVTAIEYELL